MNKTEVLQTVLLCVAAAALVAALAFLYDKTQAVDLREQNEILGFLRELKEIDSRWDVDVLRARAEFPRPDCPRPRSCRSAAANKGAAKPGAAVQTHAEPGAQRGAAGTAQRRYSRKPSSSKIQGRKRRRPRVRCSGAERRGRTWRAGRRVEVAPARARPGARHADGGAPVVLLARAGYPARKSGRRSSPIADGAGRPATTRQSSRAPCKRCSKPSPPSRRF